MYKIKVDASHQFEINKADVEAIDCIETSNNTFHILQENTSVNASILDSNFNKKLYTVRVSNNIYEVILEAMKMENVINSPRDGVIKSIKVKQGEAVDKNSLLIEFE